MPIPAVGGLVLIQHQSHDTETASQHNTHDGSSGRPSALLEFPYFTGELQYIIFYNIILGLGKTTNSQDRFLRYVYCLLSLLVQVQDHRGPAHRPTNPALSCPYPHGTCISLTAVSSTGESVKTTSAMNSGPCCTGPPSAL